MLKLNLYDPSKAVLSDIAIEVLEEIVRTANPAKEATTVVFFFNQYLPDRPSSRTISIDGVEVMFTPWRGLKTIEDFRGWHVTHTIWANIERVEAFDEMYLRTFMDERSDAQTSIQLVKNDQ